jgi:hypothetical protein
MFTNNNLNNKAYVNNKKIVQILIQSFEAKILL